MADTLPLAFQAEFDSRVEVVYQGHQMLMDRIYQKTGVVGKYCQFRRVGRGVATPHVRNAPLTSLNLDTIVQTAELTDWDAPERLDPFDLAKINWDDMGVVAESLGLAIARRADQIKIDAFQAGVTQTIPVTYGAMANTGLTVLKINHARAILQQNAVPMQQGRWCAAISGEASESALNEEKIGSQFYNMFLSLFQGQIVNYSNFEFVVIPNVQEGGLPLSGDIRSCYFFDKMCAGYAEGLQEGMDGRVRTDWSPDYQGWILNARLSAGAKVIEPSGLIEVLVDQTKIGS